MKVKMLKRSGNDPTSRMVYTGAKGRRIGARATRYVKKIVAQGKAIIVE
jgi:hypothetical protein